MKSINYKQAIFLIGNLTKQKRTISLIGKYIKLYILIDVCFIKTFAKDDAMAYIIRHIASSTATTPSKVEVKGPLALSSLSTIL